VGRARKACRGSLAPFPAGGVSEILGQADATPARGRRQERALESRALAGRQPPGEVGLDELVFGGEKRRERAVVGEVAFF
jgi:hypothetical protein